ncbi:MAG: class I SAM-dependent methyltransferase [Candidatus Omnitrophica bacterium]|nr:class I SAM-dependent methyltransferase [Candidatus Omnitrophota bacterium]
MLKEKSKKTDRYISSQLYMETDYYKKPKELFKQIGRIIAGRISKKKLYSILDVGCAKGEFLYYLKKNNMPFLEMVGIDFSKNLIDEARCFEGLQGVNFHCNLAQSFNQKKQFDFVTIISVLSFFDEPEIVLSNLKKHLKKNGLLYVVGIFNNYNVDVLIKYRNNKYSNEFENGMNNYSLETTAKILGKLNMKISHCYKFNMPFRLQKQKNPIRSWIMETPEGRKFVTGHGLIYDMYILEIKNIK